MDNLGDCRLDRIHAFVHPCVPLIQRLHAGRHAGLFGHKTTLAKLQQWFLWGAMLFPGNGPQFVAAVVRDFCANVVLQKIYSTPYDPQGDSAVDSYMRSLKKRLSALVVEDGSEWDLFLPAVALVHNATPHLATGSSSFFLNPWARSSVTCAGAPR